MPNGVQLSALAPGLGGGPSGPRLTPASASQQAGQGTGRGRRRPPYNARRIAARMGRDAQICYSSSPNARRTIPWRNKATRERRRGGRPQEIFWGCDFAQCSCGFGDTSKRIGLAGLLSFPSRLILTSQLCPGLLSRGYGGRPGGPPHMTCLPLRADDCSTRTRCGGRGWLLTLSIRSARSGWFNG